MGLVLVPLVWTIHFIWSLKLLVRLIQLCAQALIKTYRINPGNGWGRIIKTVAKKGQYKLCLDDRSLPSS